MENKTEENSLEATRVDMNELFEIEEKLKEIAREHEWMDETNLTKFIFPIWLFMKYQKKEDG